MLVSLRWLKEFCQFPSESELIDDLNRIGFEVESVTKKGEGLSNIIIGGTAKNKKLMNLFFSKNNVYFFNLKSNLC